VPEGRRGNLGRLRGTGTGDNQVLVFESRRVGKRKWLVAGSGTSAVEARLTAFAYCSKEEPGLKAKRARTTTTHDTVVLSEKARCKRGQQALSGGFGTADLTFSGNFLDQFLVPFEFRGAGKRGWKASAAAYTTDAAPVTWDVYAYCLKKDKG
jgi:hypothetical protein